MNSVCQYVHHYKILGSKLENICSNKVVARCYFYVTRHTMCENRSISRTLITFTMDKSKLFGSPYYLTYFLSCYHLVSSDISKFFLGSIDFEITRFCCVCANNGIQQEAGFKKKIFVNKILEMVCTLISTMHYTCTCFIEYNPYTSQKSSYRYMYMIYPLLLNNVVEKRNGS